MPSKFDATHGASGGIGSPRYSVMFCTAGDNVAAGRVTVNVPVPSICRFASVIDPPVHVIVYVPAADDAGTYGEVHVGATKPPGVNSWVCAASL